jgi:hypothetical protein
MSISEFDLVPGSADAVPVSAETPLHSADAAAKDEDAELEQRMRRTPRCTERQQLHRIGEVRREQGVSTRRAAQLLGKTGEQIRIEEEPTSDLTLTQVYEWQRLLEVPVADLLVEPHAPLSAPVLRRAQMLRMMKTMQAIMEKTTQTPVRRLAQTMINQLIEIMPELEGVSPWHAFDPRTQNPNGRILEQAYLNNMAMPPSDVD